METTVAERLTTFRLKIRVSETLFASQLNVVQSTLNRQIKSNTLDLQTVILIFKRYPELSINWLLFGEGEMFNKSPEPHQSDAELQDTCIEQAKEIYRLKKRIKELESK